MPEAIKAGIMFSILGFVIGSVLGTIRVLYLVPRYGPDMAVLIELPVILAISWNACGIILRHIPVPAAIGARLVMGAIALALLLLTEFTLAVVGVGQSVAKFFAQYATAAGAIGLAGQVLFGFIPVARLTIPHKASD